MQGGLRSSCHHRLLPGSDRIDPHAAALTLSAAFTERRVAEPFAPTTALGVIESLTELHTLLGAPDLPESPKAG